ncbi:MAG TPA: methyltransferase domain-containing protein [Thermodesulfobacteriota bacterium]|nr:methyltransferase domain-containing protein [Thermodesulfobacteriota bacterium]
METRFNAEETKRIREGVSEKYRRVAISPEGNFNYPTGQAGLKGQKYDPRVLRKLPKGVLASYCGVGNPFSLGRIKRGETVLDIGCGAGVDTLVAAIMVGSKGHVTGIDLTPEMLKRATTNLEKTSLKNVSFQEVSAEQLPFPDGAIDVVISNGVFNLIPDKVKALQEVFRVLKPSGRFLLADQVLMGDEPDDTKSMVENWAG